MEGEEGEEGEEEDAKCKKKRRCFWLAEQQSAILEMIARLAIEREQKGEQKSKPNQLQTTDGGQFAWLKVGGA